MSLRAQNTAAAKGEAAKTATASAPILLHPLAHAAPKASLSRDLTGSLRILTCGSVDDGKSTLIGRLLWDASDLYDDQRETIRRSN